MNYLEPSFRRQEIGRISILGLAQVGDAVYELLVRTRLLSEDHTAALDLHRETVRIVNAGAQALAFMKIAPMLSEEENAVFKRGRNAKVNQVPHHATVADYHTATGLEALFGWLYLQGQRDRIAELFARIMEEG